MIPSQCARNFSKSLSSRVQALRQLHSTQTETATLGSPSAHLLAAHQPLPRKSATQTSQTSSWTYLILLYQPARANDPYLMAFYPPLRSEDHPHYVATPNLLPHNGEARSPILLRQIHHQLPPARRQYRNCGRRLIHLSWRRHRESRNRRLQIGQWPNRKHLLLRPLFETKHRYLGPSISIHRLRSRVSDPAAFTGK